jgi:putative membrane protein
VPFFDSLSYVFLTYCSYTTALFILSPLATKGMDLITLETRAIRHSWAALVLGAFLQTFLDIIIDPVALQGNRWFLGQIYGYYEAGLHFGVPISNYAGWLLTSFILVAAFQRIDLRRDEKAPRGVSAMPFRSLLGPVLYLSVLIFNWIVTLWIGENLIALTGILIFTLPIVMTIVLAVLRVNRYREEELQEHLKDYPWSPLTGR